ncbi:type III PLP-dependent enzyme [Streptomyces albidus (ex Kaewkla and Franco 2022)]|uniref:type III PLP-dependent enzyme n=1 Tax=Streptomyces albidus (ex Kaewkla and Franco 2022) TaxID=722709 RepID=UPI0015EF9012|nr:type III PLP-dependent enzyme [Streptomyces albidus (ex Kaewkla and Franco 2022)]
MSLLTPAARDAALALAPDELPCYIYDLSALRQHVTAIRAALPQAVELYYAAKANPEPEILRTLAPFTDGFEVSSGGELAHVRSAVQGPLAFGGPGKTPDEIVAALTAGVERFHVESLHELRLLARAASRHHVGSATRPRVLIRFNPPVTASALHGSALAMGGRPTPFGMDPAQAAQALSLFVDGELPELELVGLHAHLASGLGAEAQLALAEEVVAEAMRLAARCGVRLRELTVGGGMGVDYSRPAERFDWSSFGAGMARIAERHPGPVLRIEPGRALTAYCGWYATEVLDVKRSHGEDFAVVRGGTHHLRTPAAKGHEQPAEVLAVERWPHPLPRPVAQGSRVTFTGQLCTPKDVLARDVPAPGIRAGDRAVFALAGAYAWNISHHDFLMHPPPGFRFLHPRETDTAG